MVVNRRTQDVAAQVFMALFVIAAYPRVSVLSSAAAPLGAVADCTRRIGHGEHAQGLMGLPKRVSDKQRPQGLRHRNYALGKSHL